MAVTDGSPVDAANTNASYMDKNTATTSTIAIVSLLNALTESGPSVTNLQASVNSSEKQVQVITNLLDTNSIVINESQGEHILFVQSSSGAIILSSTPFGVSYDGLDGTRVTLIGTSDTNTVSLLFSDTAKGSLINGSALLEQGDSLTLIWNSTLDRWLEVSRSF